MVSSGCLLQSVIDTTDFCSISIKEVIINKIFVVTYPEEFWILACNTCKHNNIIHLFCLLCSGGVVIYFDRIEVVNILEASSGEI